MPVEDQIDTINVRVSKETKRRLQEMCAANYRCSERIMVEDCINYRWSARQGNAEPEEDEESENA